MHVGSVRLTFLAWVAALLVICGGSISYAATPVAAAEGNPPGGAVVGARALAGTNNICAQATGIAYHCGPLVSQPTVNVVFWLPSGYHLSAMASSAVDSYYESTILQFFNDVSGSGLSHALAAYSMGGATNTIGTQSALGGVDFDTSAYPGCTDPSKRCTISDADVQARLNADIGSQQWVDGANALFVVIVAKNILVNAGLVVGDQYCGYHSAEGTNYSRRYAVIGSPDTNAERDTCYVLDTSTPGYFPHGQALDSELSWTSHEFSEAVTDPIPGSGWGNPAPGNSFDEVGDLCERSANTDAYFTDLHGDPFVLQAEWARTGGCLPIARQAGSIPVNAQGGELEVGIACQANGVALTACGGSEAQCGPDGATLPVCGGANAQQGIKMRANCDDGFHCRWSAGGPIGGHNFTTAGTGHGYTALVSGASCSGLDCAGKTVRIELQGPGTYDGLPAQFVFRGVSNATRSKVPIPGTNPQLFHYLAVDTFALQILSSNGHEFNFSWACYDCLDVAPFGTATIYGVDSFFSQPNCGSRVAGSNIIGPCAYVSNLYTVDPGSAGKDIKLGKITLSDGTTDVLINSVAMAPDGTLYGITRDFGDYTLPGYIPNALYKISTFPCCTATLVAPVQSLTDINMSLEGITFSPAGRLFATVGPAPDGTAQSLLIQVNTSNGIVQQLFGTLMPGFFFDGAMAFGPDNTLYTAVCDDTFCGTGYISDGIATFQCNSTQCTGSGYGAASTTGNNVGYASMPGFFFVGGQLYATAQWQSFERMQLPCSATQPQTLFLLDINIANGNAGSQVRCTAATSTTRVPFNGAS